MSLSFSLGHLLKDAVINMRILCQNQYAGTMLSAYLFLMSKEFKNWSAPEKDAHW